MKGKRGFSFLLLLVFIILGCIRMATAANVPKEAKIHNQLGNEYCDKGEFEKGVEEYEKAVELYPDYTDGLYNLCMTCYLDLKDYEKAIYYIKRFLAIEGDSPDAKQVKIWLDDAQQKVAALKKEIQPPQKKSLPPVEVLKKKEKIPEKMRPSKEIVGIAKPLVPKARQPATLAKDVPTSPVPKPAEITPLPQKEAAIIISPEQEARKSEAGNGKQRLGRH